MSAPHQIVPRSPRHLVVAASRLPVAWTTMRGWTRAPGGLVTAVEPLAASGPFTWIGRTGLDAPDHLPRHTGMELDVVDVDTAAAWDAEDIANRALWPALHGMDEMVHWHDGCWDGYVALNEAFARSIAAHADADAMVWVHDFHLLLVPEFVRARRPDVRIGFSFHTPVVGDSVRALPQADVLFEAVAAADCVGVQTEADRRAVTSLLSLSDSPDGAATPPNVFVSPASIDAAAVVAALREPATRVLIDRERLATGERALIVGVDRLDYTKGVLERLEAIALAFERGWIDPTDVRFVQIAQPTREGYPEYRNLRVAVERLVHDIQARWARRDGAGSVEVIFDTVDRRRVAALLATADICAVTPHRDGMNLVAKEFSILNEQHQGVLVLSSHAGAAAELGDRSVLVDTIEPHSIARALQRAMTMSSANRRADALGRAAAVRGWTARDWSEQFLGCLDHMPARAVQGAST